MSDRGGGPAHLDGAFLLQLLRRPQSAAPSPTQQPHSDPAVTAVGNSYAFPPHSFRPPPPPSEPHHFQPPPSLVRPAFAPFVPDFSARPPDSALGVRAENLPHNFPSPRPPDSALGMGAEDSPHNFPGPRPSSGDSRFPQRDSFRGPGAYDVRRESARVENFPKRDDFRNPRLDYGVRRENARVENLPQRDGFRGPRTDYDVRRENARVDNLPQRDGFRGPRTDYDVRQENARLENLPQRDGFRGPRTDYDVRRENARVEKLPQRDGFRGPRTDYDVRRENARLENLPQRDGFRGFGADYDARREIARVESFPQNFQGDRRGLGSAERIPHNGAGRWKAVVGNGVGVDSPGEWGKGRGPHPEPMRQEPLPRFRTAEQGWSPGPSHRQNGPPEWVPFKRSDDLRNGEQAEYYRRKENGWSAPSGSERHGGQGSRSEYRPTSQARQPGDAQSKSVGSTDDDGRKVVTNGSVDDSLSRGEVSEEQDVLAEQLTDALMLKEGTGEKKARRYKDLRSDSFRGNHVSSQRTRIHRRETDCRFDIKIFASSFLSIYKSLIPAEEEKEKQKQLLLTLEKLVAKEWPSGELHIYGSCANSFGFSNSDIDICLAIEGISMSKSEILLKLADILQADNLENVQALTHARVPIVKLMDPVTGISCDICINNLLAVVNTKLLRDYAQIDERLPQLAFIVKHWAKSRGVNETYRGTLSSYAYVLMCIHFLQLRIPAILPCLQEMEATYDATVDDTRCAYFDRVEELKGFGAKNKENIAYLLWAFFQYWAYYYDYTDDVISVRTGRIISKRSKGWTKRILNDRHLICIEDPFETSHDLGRVVDKFTIRILREEFERAADVLQYDPNPTVTLFQPYVPPTPRN